MNYLQWASTLTNAEFLEEDQKHLAVPTYQATTAKEIIELYNWWKVIRPLRKDASDISGWSAYCDQDKDLDDMLISMTKEKTDEEKAEVKRMIDMMNDIEKQYDDEDEEMMIRLIKIRKGLWT